ncbi:N-acyl-D-amino-acid deacylase family protein [Roseicyclus sp.]|uniref:N-acyl-D-amino-acid deacylase family protein n=1 Tax=Roseicyclus sp. TaxID=1914329 RepID=UPI003FA0CDC7
MTLHDVVIRGACVIDGTGAAGFEADVYLRGDRISAIRAPEAPEPADGVVEASGLVLAPGFIDVHTHDDMALIHTPDMRAKVSQGVTTVITGLCGYSPAPLPTEARLPEEYDILIPSGHRGFERFADYLSAVDAAGPAVNSLSLVGHSSLRIAAMSDLSRPATPVELAQMCALLDAALTEGAAGLSSGLAYAMANAAPTKELIVLCSRLVDRQAPYVTHVRDEGDGLAEAVEEALEIGRRAGVPVILSHHKALGARNHGVVGRTLEYVDRACACHRVGLDVYPYTYSSTSLTPERAARGGEIVVTRSGAMPSAVGRSLTDVAADLGCDPVEAARLLQPAGALFHLMAEEDVRRVLTHPLTMIGSDGLPFDPMPHPRLWGTFPRVLGHYVRDLGLLTLEAAIHKMTGLPARFFGLAGRGLIAEEAFADLVLFDPAAVADQAVPADPTAASVGIRSVWINGATPAQGTGRRLVANSSPIAGEICRSRSTGFRT